MNYLIDTCVVSDFFKKLPETICHFEKLSPKQIHISSISIMEIEYGLKLNIEKEKKLRFLWNALLNEIQIIPFSDTCAREAAVIRSNLKISGQIIGPYDILIAGTAIAYDLIIVTSNVGEFNRIPTIFIEDWRKN